jgi:CHAT domain-containing protein/Tfp pilus assembly protein PilF
VIQDLGDVEKAEEYLLAALEIRQRVAPGSVFVAHSLNNLGLIAHARGDLEVAAEYYRRANEIKKRVVPETVSAAFTLNNMGTVAMTRNELDLAADYFEQSLAIKERRTPGALSVATSLSNLGALAVLRDDQGRAEQYFQRALVIRQRHSPRSTLVASSLKDLGDLALNQSQLDKATEYYERAVEIWNMHAPDGIGMANPLRGLGEVAFLNGDLITAENRLQRALAIELKSVPDAKRTAVTLFLLAEVFRMAEQLELAVEYSRQAIDVLERQIGRLGGSHDMRAGFRALHEKDFRRHIELLLMTGHEAEAFHALERSRARSLLDMLAERDLVFAVDVPDELDRARRRLAVQYDRKQQQIAELDTTQNGDKLPELIRERDELRRRQDENTEAIRRASPRLAALKYPQPLQLEAAIESLDPGTVMLSYSVGETHSDLFVLTPNEGLTVIRLDVGEKEINLDVEQFRSLIQETRAVSLRMANVVATGKRLFNRLVEPAVSLLNGAERVLILPDGPLRRLPFAALVVPRPEAETRRVRDWRYLGEWKALHFVQSATLFAELKRDRCVDSGWDDSSQTPTVVAFGNPLTADTSEPGVARSERRQRLEFKTLPATRIELERIGALYSDKAAVYLGKEANEEAVLGIGIGPRIFHFATHSRLDDRLPLDSGLVLSPPEETRDGIENGLLQAWEIIERIRISADLVVLSACRSGLGKELGGEGLIGLTRAFQYAGARSVVASLWDAADAKTADLMVRFHAHLIQGKSTAEALQAAQVELIRGESGVEPYRLQNSSAPYYWAGFQVYGDWN